MKRKCLLLKGSCADDMVAHLTVAHPSTLHVQSPRHLCGSFFWNNLVGVTCLIVHNWVADKKSAYGLKGLCTEDKLAIDEKGKPTRIQDNTLQIIILVQECDARSLWEI